MVEWPAYLRNRLPTFGIGPFTCPPEQFEQLSELNPGMNLKWIGCVATVAGLIAVASQVPDDRIDESSGIAASLSVANRFWTHNDSGDSARLFAINERGETIKSVTIEHAKAIDWEDMAGGVVDGKKILIVGDVGDNARRRESIQLYILPDPEESLDSVPCVTINVRYPDGAGDCEAVAIDAENHRALLVKKTRLPLAGVYAIDIKDQSFEFENTNAASTNERSQNKKPVEITAERIATVPIRMVTGIDIRSDGRQMVVASYRDVFVFDREQGQTWEAAMKQTPCHAQLPRLKQIEAVCYDGDGHLWITSEGSPMPLVKIDNPANAPE